MEGVGARLGRSSTRYGPATVFNGPVRKWKKKWVHVAPSSSSSSSSTTAAAASNSNNTNSHHSQKGPSNGNNGSHLVLYKWTPITPRQNNNNNADKKQDNQHLPSPPDQPPRRKFKYIPIALLEEQKIEETENGVNENVEDDAKPQTTDQNAAEQTPKDDVLNEKPDINYVPMEESQAQGNYQAVRQDLNESTLDLSLGLTAREDEETPHSKSNKKDGK